MTAYKTWGEAKQAIMDKTGELLSVGDEPGVESISFGFDIDYNLLPTVTYTVTRKMWRESEKEYGEI